MKIINLRAFLKKTLSPSFQNNSVTGTLWLQCVPSIVTYPGHSENVSQICDCEATKDGKVKRCMGTSPLVGFPTKFHTIQTWKYITVSLYCRRVEILKLSPTHLHQRYSGSSR